MLRRIVLNGVYVSVICLMQHLFNFLGVPEGNEAMMSSVIFTLFVLFQLFNAFNCRELGKESIFKNLFKNRLMLLSFAVTFALQVVITQFGGLFFDTVPLDALMWLKVVALAFSIVLLNELVKLVERLFGKKKTN